jgi:hypothetical protein
MTSAMLKANIPAVFIPLMIFAFPACRGIPASGFGPRDFGEISFLSS